MELKPPTVEHERIVAYTVIDSPNTRWQWTTFTRCEIYVDTPNQTFHRCILSGCTYVRTSK